MRILIVEDNPTDLKLFTDVLVYEGHDVIPAENDDDAHKALQETSVDIILVDILLPGGDGLNFVRRIKSHGALRSIPVVAMSSVTEWPFERHARNAGCAAFLQKPIDTRTLPQQLARCLNAKRKHEQPRR